jgi:hypothetical protein
LAVVALAAPPAPRKLRVGIFAEHALQPRWLAEAFAEVARAECAEIVALVVDGAPPRAARWWMRATDLREHVPHTNLAQPDLDVAFALGGFDDTKLDGIARLGVWRLHLEGAHAVLAVRLAAGDAPRVACESWGRSEMLQKAARLPLRALEEAQRSGRAWLEQRRPLSGTQAQAEISRPLLPMLQEILRRGLEQAAAPEQWSLAFRFGALTPDLAGFTRIVPPRGRDWSDPFVLERNGHYYVFFADTGHIAMLEISRDGRCTAPVRVLERDYAVSHPFLLEHEGNLYLVPDTARNRTLEIYRCVDFPLRWRRERVLLEGVRLADATFHRGPERWWMFANGNFDDELHLLHARHLFGDWQPHVRNPVKSDARSSRPAGALYWRNGALYRPAQICAPQPGLSINRVLRLTPECYAERQVERVLPGGDNGLRGLHTVNRADELTVIDMLARRRRI